jgi:hypothetical protein
LTEKPLGIIVNTGSMMKRGIAFFGIIAALAIAVTFVSCSNPLARESAAGGLVESATNDGQGSGQTGADTVTDTETGTGTGTDAGTGTGASTGTGTGTTKPDVDLTGTWTYKKTGTVTYSGISYSLSTTETLKFGAGKTFTVSGLVHANNFFVSLMYGDVRYEGKGDYSYDGTSLSTDFVFTRYDRMPAYVNTALSVAGPATLQGTSIYWSLPTGLKTYVRQ